MRERESKIANINQKMHYVTDVHDFGQLVIAHQEQIDVIEDSMCFARELQKANAWTNSNSHFNYDDNDGSEY